MRVITRRLGAAGRHGHVEMRRNRPARAGRSNGDLYPARAGTAERAGNGGAGSGIQRDIGALRLRVGAAREGRH